MNEIDTNKMMDLLEKLATSIGTTIEHLWPMIVAQTRLSNLIELILCVILLLIPGSYICNMSFRSGKLEKCFPDNGSEITIYGAIYVICCIIFGCSFIGFWIKCSTWITGIINPEYQSLKFLLNYIKF